MTKMQQTIKENISFSGTGIHTGVFTNMTLKPAKEEYGIRFIRVDLEGSPVIKADVANVFTTERSTSLKRGNAKIHTVEHILAAIIGAGIDNVIIEIDNVEIPILDGSAKEFLAKIENIGVVIQKSKRKYFEINKPVILSVGGAEFKEIKYAYNKLNKNLSNLTLMCGFQNFPTKVNETKLSQIINSSSDILLTLCCHF